MSFTSLLARQIAFSRATFGPNERTEGVLDHITKEQSEVRDSHDALARALEWTDIHMLARDGHWRAVAAYAPDATNDQIAEIVEKQLVGKLDENERRDWPYWKDIDESKAIEHVKNKRGWPEFTLTCTGVSGDGLSFTLNHKPFNIRNSDMEVMDAKGNLYLVAIRRSVAIDQHLMPASDEYVTMTLYFHGDSMSTIKLSVHPEAPVKSIPKRDVSECQMSPSAESGILKVTLRKSAATKAGFITE